MTILRRISGFLAGVIVTWLPVGGAQMIVHVLHPPVAGTDMHDMTQIKRYVATLPTTAMVIVLVGWAIGTVAGTFTAARIGRTAALAYALGALLIVVGVSNAIVFPQPLWFSVVSLLIYAGGTWCGARLSEV